MYILVIFIWLQSAGGLDVRYAGFNVEPKSYQTASLCDEAGQSIELIIPTNTLTEYSWRSPKCVFVEKPI